MLRQQEDEIKALYGSGPYRLSTPFKKFLKDSVVFHNMSPENRRKYVQRFRNYQPNLEDSFTKPAGSGRKPSQGKRKRKPSPEVFIDRVSNGENLTVNNPNDPGSIIYELHFRSNVPRLVTRCQGNCGENLVPMDEDYMLVKSFNSSTYMHDGQSKSKYGPQYIHFKIRCLKEYARRKHDKIYSADFPIGEIRVDDKTKSMLNENMKADLREYGVKIE